MQGQTNTFLLTTKFILKFYYDEERFDANGIGDYTEFVGDYEEFTCIEDVEKKLLKDIMV